MNIDITELKNTANTVLANHRQKLLNKYPFIGSVAMGLELVPIRDVRCETAMTDGKSIFFDIAFLSELTDDEGVFVLGHEVWHVVMMHFLRGTGKEHTLFNIATDMEVNQLLEQDGLIPPKNVLFPNKKHNRDCEFDFPDNLSAEEYYDLLLKKMSHMKQNMENMEAGDNKKKRGSKSSSAIAGQFDKHYDKNTDYNKEKVGEVGTDKYGKKGFDEDFNPGNSGVSDKQLAEDIRQSIVSAAQTVERTRGSLPGHVKKIVNAVLESKLHWKELLAKFITSGFESKNSWNVPNRRFVHNGTYLPSNKGEMMKIAIGIDTSGSCSEDCCKFLTEINGIANTFGSYELHIIQCDTEVKDYNIFDQYNPLKPENVTFKGFGGTELKPIFDHIELNDLDVSGIVIFTDGECETFDNPFITDKPVLWVVTGNRTSSRLQIGEQILMD